MHVGGDGLVKELELLTDASVTLLADRRERGPYGLAGGSDGMTGRAAVLGQAEELPGKFSVRLPRGTKLRLETPGGGGWGIARKA